VLALSALTGCASRPAPTPTSATQLGLTGQLFFHRYSDYGAWDSRLFQLDLASGQLAEISRDWTSVVSPINAHPNADGTELTFMATQAGLVENEWDVFVTRWLDGRWAEPVNLTGPNGKRDEDPKFAPNGHTIAYKEDGVLATISDTGDGKRLLSVGKSESSMPYPLPDGTGMLFERDGSIWLQRTDGTEQTVWSRGESHAYYPIAVDANKFLFTEVQASGHDRIDFGFVDGSAAQPLAFGSNSCDNSDPYPYQDAGRFIFYVTGCPVVLRGGYNLAVADIQSNKQYSLGDINPDSESDDLELGPAWSSTAQFPTA